jgi:hypothetical protein
MVRAAGIAAGERFGPGKRVRNSSDVGPIAPVAVTAWRPASARSAGPPPSPRCSERSAHRNRQLHAGTGCRAGRSRPDSARRVNGARGCRCLAARVPGDAESGRRESDGSQSLCAWRPVQRIAARTPGANGCADALDDSEILDGVVFQGPAHGVQQFRPAVRQITCRRVERATRLPARTNELIPGLRAPPRTALRVGEKGGDGSDAHSDNGAQHVTPPAPGTAVARVRICGPVTTSTLTDRGHCRRLHRSRQPPAHPQQPLSRRFLSVESGRQSPAWSLGVGMIPATPLNSAGIEPDSAGGTQRWSSVPTDFTTHNQGESTCCEIQTRPPWLQ